MSGSAEVAVTQEGPGKFRVEVHGAGETTSHSVSVPQGLADVAKTMKMPGDIGAMLASNLLDATTARRYVTAPPPAQVAELVDAQVSGTCGRKAVKVRVFSWAPPSP